MDSPLASFASWMHGTAFPYLDAFMGRHADTALFHWHPPNACRLQPDEPTVLFQHIDTPIAHGLGPKPWHSAHTRLLLARHAPQFLPGFAAGVCALTTRLGRDDLTLVFAFDTTTGPMRASLTVSCPVRRLYCNAADFTTLAQMDAFVATPLRNARPDR